MNDQIPQTLGAALPPGTGICVINLDGRTDRWEIFQRETLTHFEELPINRISATLGTLVSGYGRAPYFRGSDRDKTWAARGGCVLSHRDALLHAKSNGWSYLLVLEDDIQIYAKPDLGFLSALKEALHSFHFDVCYFGYTDPVQPSRELIDLGMGRGLHQVFGCNTAHAYLLTASAIDWILDRLPSPSSIWPWLSCHRAIDRYYSRNLSPALTVLALSPSLILQKPCYSDILGVNVASCRENHRTGIDPMHPEPLAFQKQMLARASACKRLGFVDKARSLWKVLSGL
ncbi:MAG: glycosyl transferase [Verrucomicrobiota bacterium]